MDKQGLRESVWDELEDSGAARFPFPPHGRIPNYEGADTAAAGLAETRAWARADAVKANPDAPQRPVRRRALEAGKTVYVAVPRLRDEDCFLRLDPDRIDDVDRATTIDGSAELGEQVGPEGVEPIDLVVSGSVAVDPGGRRVGKGEGYSDLEFAVLREFGLVDDGTVTATTVHERQVREGPLPTSDHDVPMDRIYTPERAVRGDEAGTAAKPSGVARDALDEERIEAIPVLGRLRERDG